MIIFYSPGSTVQVLVGAFICVFFLCLVAVHKPYRDGADDATSTMSFLSLVCVLMLGMALRIQAYEATDGEAAQTAVFTWLLFLVSIMVFVFCLYQMICDTRDALADNKAKFDTVRRMTSAALFDGGAKSRADNDVDLLWSRDALGRHKPL